MATATDWAVETVLASKATRYNGILTLVHRAPGVILAGSGTVRVGEAWGATYRAMQCGQWFRTEAEARARFDAVDGIDTESNMSDARNAVPVADAVYTLSSVKHSETLTGTLAQAIERAREIDAEYQPVCGVAVECDGETLIHDVSDADDVADAMEGHQGDRAGAGALNEAGRA